MQHDHHLPTLRWLRDLSIGKEATCGNGGSWTISKHALNGMMRGLAAKTEKADRGNLMGAKVRMLCFEIDNELAHIWRKTARLVRLAVRLFFGKQAPHALFFKLRNLAVHGSFRCTRFPCPLSRRFVE